MDYQAQLTRRARNFAPGARGLILFAFILLCVPYSFATPIFEKNDEVWHFAFVQHLAIGGDLPVQSADARDAPWAQEGSQPPLYYVGAALVVRLFDTSDFDAQREPNASPIYAPYAPGNKNMLVITPEKRAFNYHNTTLAAFVLRLLGIVPGCITVWLTYALAQVITKNGSLAAVAMAFTAFNPMFLTVTTAVSNDGLLIALSTAALVLLVQCVMQASVTTGRAVVIGVLVGFASLTKISGALLLLVALVVILAPWRPAYAPWSKRFALVLVVVGLWLLIAGWWYARNYALYGDFTGVSAMAAVAGTRNISLWQALSEFEGFRMSYLGIFGQFNIPADDVAYIAFDVLLVVSAIGLAIHVFRRRRVMSPEYWRAILLLIAQIILTQVAIVRWTMMTPASHGRLLFPCIAGVSTLMAIGLGEYGPILKRLNARTSSLLQPATLFVAAMALLTGVAPFRYVTPAYTLPLITQLPEDVTPVTQRLEPWAEVLGYTMTPPEAKPGDKVRVSIVMRALKTPEFNHSLVVNLYGRDNQPLARFDTYPGGGLLPSSQWRAGDMWRDTVELTIPPDAKAPAILRAQFSLYNHGSGEIAASYDANGKAVAPLFDGATLLPAQADSNRILTRADIARFADLAALTSFTHTQVAAGQPLTVTLTWQTLKRAPQDYTVFLHLVDTEGKVRAQQDSPPDNGQFPTSRWSDDIVFDDVHVVPLPADLPPGRYRLQVGLYEPGSGARLEARNARGDRQLDDAYPLAEIEMR